jgi:hypothetical protein
MADTLKEMIYAGAWLEVAKAITQDNVKQHNGLTIEQLIDTVENAELAEQYRLEEEQAQEERRFD